MSRIDSNQNVVHIGSNPIHGARQISSAHTGTPWARVNSDIGTQCAWNLDISLITGIVGEWFGSFLAPDSKFAQLAKNIFLSSSGACFGMREDSMYRHIYAYEARTDLTDKELENQSQAYKKVNRLDDFGEAASLFKDKVINNSWRFTKLVSKIQPIVLAVGPFLGEKLNDLIFSLLQTPSRLTWRLTYMFPVALENKFVERMCNLGWLSVKSIFNGNAREELSKLKADLGKDAYQYAQMMKEFNGPNLEGKSDLAAYFSMLMDRIKQHWYSWYDTKRIIGEKIKRGELTETNEAERRVDPSKTLHKGFIDPSGNNNESASEISKIKRLSLVNLTAPFCGVIGVFGAGIAEPLRLIWKLGGIKTGARFLNVLSSLRVPASFTNYLFKFFMPEFYQGKKYYKLKETIENNPNVGEAAKVLLANYKRMRIAGRGGMFLTGLSFVDSIYMNLNVNEDSSRGIKFLRGVVGQLVNCGFVRFFSERRGFWGEKLLINQAAQRLLQKSQVSDGDILNLPQSKDKQFLHLMETLGKSEIAKETEEPYYQPLLGLSEKWGNFYNLLVGT